MSKSRNFVIDPETATFQRLPSENIRRTLCGIVECFESKANLNQDDVVVVTLFDTTDSETSRIDFPHIPHRYIIATVKLDDCGYFPVPFTLYYNDDQIDRNLCYGIRCDVIDGNNKIKYTSDRFVPVLTDNNPTNNVNITVQTHELSDSP